MSVGYWQPQIGTSWQWQLDGTLNTAINAVVYDVDVSDWQGDLFGAAMVSKVKSGHSERKVICYVNIGSLEMDGSRSDQNLFAVSDLGGTYPGWPDEQFVNIRSQNVRKLMQARFQTMQQAGCDAIEPDNMALDYANLPSGFRPPLTDADSIDYINWFTSAIHSLNMAVACKNGGVLLSKNPSLVSKFDFAIVEECVANSDCSIYNPFIAVGKPVFAADYTDAGVDGGCSPIKVSATKACDTLNSFNFEGIIKTCGLTAKVTQCRGLLSANVKTTTTTTTTKKKTTTKTTTTKKITTTKAAAAIAILAAQEISTVPTIPSEYSKLLPDDQTCINTNYNSWAIFMPKHNGFGSVDAFCSTTTASDISPVTSECSSSAKTFADFVINYCKGITGVPNPVSDTDALSQLVAISQASPLSTKTCWTVLGSATTAKAACADILARLVTCIDSGEAQMNLGSAVKTM
ncbi:UNVERIFIED_CONTAM: hypothetical protein HDU68_002143, partial [Siphonaria sp. JEL0065]